MFRRVDFGLQGGVVFDLLREDTYFQTQLTQLRGNLSFAFLNQSEIGFEFARHLDSQVEREWIRGATATTALESEIVATDTNRFYWSTLLPAQPRIRTDVGLGFASGQRFLVDGSLTMPLSRIAGFRTHLTYLHPQGDPDAYLRESYALSLELVLVPFRSTNRRYDRSFFSVADNGSFLTERR